MKYKEFIPSEKLKPYIKCFWTMESPGSNIVERIVPDGRMELIIHYLDPFQQIMANGHGEIQPRSFIYGQINRYIEIQPTGAVGILGVRFRRAGFYPFLGIPALEFNESSVSLPTLFGNEGRDLENRIMECISPIRRIAVLEQFLESKLGSYAVPDSVVITLEYLEQSHGNVSITELCHTHKINIRKLHRTFREFVGLNPKRMANILKLQKFFNMLHTHPQDTLTQLSLDSGYYDQAHFIREFRKMVGVSPKAYLNAHYPMAGHFY